eukprot:scaffold7029_cov66-Phaeocystis_antarctica.AAC.4
MGSSADVPRRSQRHFPLFPLPAPLSRDFHPLSPFINSNAPRAVVTYSHGILGRQRALQAPPSALGSLDGVGEALVQHTEQPRRRLTCGAPLQQRGDGREAARLDELRLREWLVLEQAAQALGRLGPAAALAALAALTRLALRAGHRRHAAHHLQQGRHRPRVKHRPAVGCVPARQVAERRRCLLTCRRRAKGQQHHERKHGARLGHLALVLRCARHHLGRAHHHVQQRARRLLLGLGAARGEQRHQVGQRALRHHRRLSLGVPPRQVHQHACRLGHAAPQRANEHPHTARRAQRIGGACVQSEQQQRRRGDAYKRRRRRRQRSGTGNSTGTSGSSSRGGGGGGSGGLQGQRGERREEQRQRTRLKDDRTVRVTAGAATGGQVGQRACRVLGGGLRAVDQQGDEGRHRGRRHDGRLVSIARGEVHQRACCLLAIAGGVAATRAEQPHQRRDCAGACDGRLVARVRVGQVGERASHLLHLALGL